VGGDGLFNELLNGILLQSQYNAGVNLKRARFIPVQPFIRLGMIPAGATDSIVHSAMGYSNPVAAAAQIILGEYPQSCVYEHFCVCINMVPVIYYSQIFPFFVMFPSFILT